MAFLSKGESEIREFFSSCKVFCALYIDNHTHIAGIIEKKAEILQVYALDPARLMDGTVLSDIVQAGHHFTLGLHPQSILDMNIEEFRMMVKTNADSLLAIGECGLDTFVSTIMQEQIDAFKQQAYLAEEYGKPLVIHCVRSHDQILQLHQEIKPKKSWIMHGFNRNEHIARALINHGIVLSFGKELLNEQHLLSTYLSELKDIPFLLETDGKDIRIEQLYEHCSHLLGIDIRTLKQRIATHFTQIYGTI